MVTVTCFFLFSQLLSFEGLSGLEQLLQFTVIKYDNVLEWDIIIISTKVQFSKGKNSFWEFTQEQRDIFSGNYQLLNYTKTV